MTAAPVWHGPDELRRLLTPLDGVERHPRNPRRGDVLLVAESLERYGQTRPIVIWRRETGLPWIVAGNHTWQAASKLGWTHIAAVADPAMGEAEALDYLLMDNAAADKAGYDDAGLVQILNRLYDQGRLAGTGFTPDDLDDLIARANLIPETARQEFQGGYAETPEEEAARAARAGGQGQVKQLLLSYSPDDYRRFSSQLSALAKEYGTSGVTATVEEAVSRAFAEVWV